MPEDYHTELDWQERALHYGDGLFETLLKYEGDLPYWQEHFQRLARGCERLQISLPSQDWLYQQIHQASESRDHAIIKLIVSRGRGGRGLQLPTDSRASVFVFSYPWQPVKSEVRVALCSKRLPLNPDLAGIKHLNRLDYVLAALEIRDRTDIDEGLVCDSDGFLVEGLISNLFFVGKGRVYTPSLEQAGVDGILRHKVIDRLQQDSMPVEIGRFTPQQLMDADECFLCNSVRGIRPVVSIDDRDFAVGDLSLRLMSTLNIPPITL